MFSIASFFNDPNDSTPSWLEPSISMLTRYAASPSNTSSLSVIYNPDTPVQYSGSNSFAIGSLFAPLVLGSNPPPGKASVQGSSGHKNIVAPVVGGVLGGCFTLFVLSLGIWIRRRGSHQGNPIALMSGIKRGWRGLRKREDEISEVETRCVIFPPASGSSRDEGSISSFHLDDEFAADASLRQVHQSRASIRKVRSDQKSVESSRFQTASESTNRVPGSQSSSSGAQSEASQRLEDQLAALKFEIQMVREAVRIRPADTHDEGERAADAPPSYTGREDQAFQ
ncbi:hypothetical protein SCHPADRAFT_243920 [Schizopora paradoxa]|uniref:DUF1793 domain-containing protein n=1 Tax=Schizopora paradoxa TaxID=27342 RepID=A0A0H2RVZ3_9AGAM|nr:hypothetical protein SCHPADRAFT_243920 [Schizopora paradoxa]